MIDTTAERYIFMVNVHIRREWSGIVEGTFTLSSSAKSTTSSTLKIENCTTMFMRGLSAGRDNLPPLLLHLSGGEHIHTHQEVRERLIRRACIAKPVMVIDWPLGRFT